MDIASLLQGQLPQTDRASTFVSTKIFGQGQGRGQIFLPSTLIIMQNLVAVQPYGRMGYHMGVGVPKIGDASWSPAPLGRGCRRPHLIPCRICLFCRSNGTSVITEIAGKICALTSHLSRSLRVIGTLPTSDQSLTSVISRNVCKINDDFGRKSQNVLRVYLTLPLRGSLGIL